MTKLYPKALPAVSLVSVLFLGVLFCLYPSNVYAKKRFGLLGLAATGASKVYGKDTLTVSELRNCLVLEKDLSSSQKAISPKESELSQKAAEMDKVKDELKESMKYIEKNRDAKFSTQAEVDNFNQAVDSYNKKSTSYNTLLENYKRKQNAFNAGVDSHNALQDNHNKLCAGKSYYEEDYKEASQ